MRLTSKAMENQQLNAFEQLAIVRMLEEHLPKGSAERVAAGIRVLGREVDGAGFITEFAQAEPIEALAGMEPPCLTVVSQHHALSQDAIFSLFLAPDGGIESLEGATFAGEAWPVDSGDFRFDNPLPSDSIARRD